MDFFTIQVVCLATSDSPEEMQNDETSNPNYFS